MRIPHQIKIILNILNWFTYDYKKLLFIQFKLVKKMLFNADRCNFKCTGAVSFISLSTLETVYPVFYFFAQGKNFIIPL